MKNAQDCVQGPLISQNNDLLSQKYSTLSGLVVNGQALPNNTKLASRVGLGDGALVHYGRGMYTS